MLIIGLTGGLGSGKSTVSHEFQKLGIDVIDTDVIAKDITQPDMPALKKIADHFKGVVNSAGILDRDKLRARVFENAMDRLWLESLLHPLIWQESLHQIAETHSPYCIVVIPLLIETNMQFKVDRVLVVDTTLEKQRERVHKGYGWSLEQIDAVMATQVSPEKRLAAADDVIDNNGDASAITKQVIELHELYLACAENED